MKKFLMILLALSVIALCACGIGDSAEEKLVYEAENSDNAEIVSYVRIEINPSYTIGMTEDCKVVSIQANNEDAENVLTNYMKGYFDEADTGVEINYFIQDLIRFTTDAGYAQDECTVEMIVESGDVDRNILEQACTECADVLHDESGIMISFHSEELSIDVNSVDGGITCSRCNGTGYVTVTYTHVECVYNGTPCRICNDVGTVDDGMHGGQRAACGECMGFGAAHSVGDKDDGSCNFNGDYRTYAFDEVEEKEEIQEICEDCGGTGRLPE